ncbi:hypothetical protein [Clostridium ihumii]|uniref:hypothetical protein n=1 Tax=Clostridium ihumii TaxID=1470356 RepID=UPI000684D6D2|nr:hypothetical protein [Clostridium ihumii]
MNFLKKIYGNLDRCTKVIVIFSIALSLVQLLNGKVTELYLIMIIIALLNISVCHYENKIKLLQGEILKLKALTKGTARRSKDIKRVEEYRIFTKDDYKRYRLAGMKAWEISKGAVEFINDSFEKIGKGEKFIIGVGRDSIMFYSIEYFNKNILG